MHEERLPWYDIMDISICKSCYSLYGVDIIRTLVNKGFVIVLI